MVSSVKNNFGMLFFFGGGMKKIWLALFLISLFLSDDVTASQAIFLDIVL